MLKHLKSRDDWNEKSFSAKGFTLIELLVVIVILGILAAVVVFAVGGISDNGQDSACRTELRTLKTAVEAYRAEEGAYPANTGAMVPDWLDQDPTWYSWNGSAYALTAAGTSDGCAAP